MSDSEFLDHIGHTPEELKAANIDVAELQRIYVDHEGREADLYNVGEAVQRSLSRFEEVHSTRLRVKSPRSLVRKVVRKRLDDPKRNISFDTYREEVRDLIGLRALHLFKEEGQLVGDAIRENWNLHPKEKPLAYLRVGDSSILEATLKAAGFKVKKKDGGYRSLHFVVRSDLGRVPYYAEIQVRTLFEEAWGEVDHRVRYPDHQDDEILNEYLLILNRLAGGADEMSSLLLRIKAAIDALKVGKQLLEKENTAKIAELEKVKSENASYIDKLKISEAEKNELKRRLEKNTKPVESDSANPDSPLAIHRQASRKSLDNLRYPPAVLEAVKRGELHKEAMAATVAQVAGIVATVSSPQVQAQLRAIEDIKKLKGY